MVTKEDIPARPGQIRVTFSVPGSIWADTIELAGDFNRWNATATPLRRLEDCWSVSLTLERGRVYGFRYLVDHQDWMGDAQADSYMLAPDGYVTSVIVAQPPIEYMLTLPASRPIAERMPGDTMPVLCTVPAQIG